MEKTELLTFLMSRAEFATLRLTDIEEVYLNCWKTGGGAYNEDWTTFNTDMAVNQAGDGKNRYVYVGKMYLHVDGAQLAFKYRDLFVSSAAEQTYNVNGQIILFDETDVGAGTASQGWQFIGYKIDRGA